jgi:hypothetical protein
MAYPTAGLLHTLMLETFRGARPSRKRYGRHLDGDKRLDNLAWGTASDNYRDGVRRGLYFTRDRC